MSRNARLALTSQFSKKINFHIQIPPIPNHSAHSSSIHSSLSIQQLQNRSTIASQFSFSPSSLKSLRYFSSNRNKSQKPQQPPPPESGFVQKWPTVPIDAEFLAKVQANPRLQRIPIDQLSKRATYTSEESFIDIFYLKKDPWCRIFPITGLVFTATLLFLNFRSFQNFALNQGMSRVLNSCTPVVRKAMILVNKSDSDDNIKITPPTLSPTQTEPSPSQIESYLQYVQLSLVMDYKLLSQDLTFTSKFSKHNLELIDSLLHYLTFYKDIQIDPSSEYYSQLHPTISTLQQILYDDLENILQLQTDIKSYLSTIPHYHTVLNSSSHSHAQLISLAMPPAASTESATESTARETPPSTTESIQNQQFTSSSTTETTETTPTPLQTMLISNYAQPFLELQHEMRNWSTISLFLSLHISTMIENYTDIIKHLAVISKLHPDITANKQPLLKQLPSAVLTTAEYKHQLEQIIDMINTIHLPPQDAAPQSDPNSLLSELNLHLPLLAETDQHQKFLSQYQPLQNKETFFQFSKFSSIPSTIADYLYHISLPAIQSQIPSSPLYSLQQLNEDESLTRFESNRVVISPSPSLSLMNSFHNTLSTGWSGLFRMFGTLGATIMPTRGLREYFQSVNDIWVSRDKQRCEELPTLVIVNNHSPSQSPTEVINGISKAAQVLPNPIYSTNQQQNPTPLTCQFPQSTFVSFGKFATAPDWKDNGVASLHAVSEMKTRLDAWIADHSFESNQETPVDGNEL